MLPEYGLSRDCLRIVRNVAEWSKEHRISDQQPDRQATCIDLGQGLCIIVICAELSDSMIADRKAHLATLGLDVGSLDSGEKYLVHLLLHEIAHIALKSDDEKYRAEWALGELPNHISLATLH
jgi:hypothetical protein